MSPKEISATIAEHCGWTPNCGYKSLTEGNFYGCAPGEDPKFSWKRIPDYYGSLDAMHDAESALSPMQAHIYSRELEAMFASRPWHDDDAAKNYGWHADAADRSEAFLRAIGKWVELSNGCE